MTIALALIYFAPSSVQTLPNPRRTSSSSSPAGVQLSVASPYPTSTHASPGTPTATPVSSVYYVSPTGSDLNPGTQDRPWKTIQKAADTLKPGETVYIGQGVYNEQVHIQRSGAPGAYITFTASPGDEVVLDGKNVDLVSKEWGGLIWVGASDYDVSQIRVTYVQISGLHIQNTSGTDPGIAGILVTDSDHIIIENNFTYNTASSGIGVWRSSDILVSGNDVQKAVNGGTQECISISGTKNFEVSYNTVHNGSGLDLGGEGISTKDDSSFGKIHNNQVFGLLHDPASFSLLQNYQIGEVGIYVDAYQSGKIAAGEYLHDVDVYNNLVYDVAAGIAIGAEQGGHIENIKVYNNIIFNTREDGIIITNWVGDNQGTKKNIAVVNNTVYQCGYGASSYGRPEWGGGISVSSTKVQGILISNNITTGNQFWQIRVVKDARSNVTITNNLAAPEDEIGEYWWVDGIRGNNPVIAEPGFEDPSINNFYLLAGSAAINAGTTLGAPAFDFDANPRPQGTGYDIGAYEFTPSAP